MPSDRPDYRELVSAAFAEEFADGVVDESVLRRIHSGAVEEWLTALDRSGLFGTDALANLAEQWHAKPSALFDAMLAGADPVTARRWRQAWATLERTEPRAELG
ncbi:hypothetical protein [Nocardia bovistercoris]|uniref:Uncharacterized protein n=1 Tax=Nocardia bovistercoris TaxID=2785916 RepID=A0A931I9F7_9NOCA|nr:hypothetical protein [Nocardia bovistercoris]MBH0777402.1 hypothetical protein [Nocardia bovistercoris]